MPKHKVNDYIMDYAGNIGHIVGIEKKEYLVKLIVCVFKFPENWTDIEYRFNFNDIDDGPFVSSSNLNGLLILFGGKHEKVSD